MAKEALRGKFMAIKYPHKNEKDLKYINLIMHHKGLEKQE
jgi:hypothetical protein